MFRDINRNVSNKRREVHRQVRNFLRPSTSVENPRQRKPDERPEREKNLPDLHKELANLKAWEKPIRPHEHLSHKERQIMTEKAFTDMIKKYYEEELHDNSHIKFIEKEYKQTIKQLNQVIDSQKNRHLADNSNEIKELLKQKRMIDCLRKIPKLQKERAELIGQQKDLADKQQELNRIKEELENIIGKKTISSDTEKREFLTMCSTIALGQTQPPEKMLQEINHLNRAFISKIEKRKERIRKIDELLHNETIYDIHNKKVIEYHSILKESKQVLSEYHQLSSDPHKYKQEQETIKEEGDRLLRELHETDKQLADLYQKRSNQGHLQQERHTILSRISTIQSKLYKLHTPEDKLFIERRKMEKLCENMEKLYQKISEEQQDEKFQILAGQLKQDNDKAKALKKDLTALTSPQNYNPYYSMDKQKNEQIVDNLVVSLKNSCGVQTIRRALYLLNRNTSESVADETKIAEAASYSDEEGTYHQEAPKAYKLFGFDYRYFQERLTINDIDRITSNGFPVHIRVYKEEIGGHALLIEKVTRSEKEKGETFMTICDPTGSITDRMKVRDIPYSELEKVLTDEYVIPANWRELKKQHETASGSR